jgi:hypothetical protein
VFFATGPSGEVLPDVDGDRQVVLEAETRDTARVTFKRGVAYLIAQPTFQSVLTVSVSGFEGTRSVLEAAALDTVFHAGPIAPAGEFWSASAVHVVDADVVVSVDTELEIEEGGRVLVRPKRSILVNGTLEISGTEARPVVLTSTDVANPWGGIEIHAGTGTFSHCFFVHGGGDEARAFGHSGSQPVLLAEDAEVRLDNCYLIDNAGKAFGGLSSRITIGSSLIARCDTGGEFVRCVTQVADTHVRDIPNADGTLVDDDNDGFYFNGVPSDPGEESVVERCSIVTTKDDGIDHNGARLSVTDTWIEDCAHEGVAASNSQTVSLYNSVLMRCAQGIEAGYGSPTVLVDHCVITQNQVGLRFGDSYDWGCNGQMSVTNTLLFANQDDVLNYDHKSGKPVADGIVLSHTLLDDPEYSDCPSCTAGAPVFTSGFRLAAGSPGKGAGTGNSDIGLVISDQAGMLVINEFMALNNSLYSDEYGDFDDWVELYNGGSVPVDIGGMYLTDDPTQPRAWQIPADDANRTVVQPGAWIVLWCDGEPEQGTLHGDLQLSGSGEYFALYDVDGETLIDSVQYGQQAPNVSYGRTQDGGASWRLFTRPTPSLSNNLADSVAVEDYFITCDPDSFAFIYKHYEQDVYIPIKFSHGARTWTNVRMRIRGDTSRKYPKKSLRLRFDSAPFSNGRSTLLFNAEYHDKSYMRQYLSSFLFRESGHPCFTSEHARLHLNGRFLGLYLRIENIDEDFLRAEGLDADGNLYKASGRGACLSIYDDVDYHWDKKTNLSAGNEELRQLIAAINSVSDEDYYEFARDSFDYERMVNIIALNILIINASTYYHNYYMYQDVAGSGKWLMMPWDMDKTFSNYSWNYSYQQSAWTNQRTPDNPFPERALISEPVFADVKHRIEELRRTLFNTQVLGPIADSLLTLLAPSVAADQTDDISTLAEWDKQYRANVDFVDGRYAILQRQLANWPHSFSLKRPRHAFTSEVRLIWHPSEDPNGDPITYSLRYGDAVDFSGNLTRIFPGLRDTVLVLPQTPPDGTYYWTVFASDGENEVEGFDSRNTFTVRRKAALPDTVRTDLTLRRSGSPYVALGDVVIEPSATLHLNPGVVIYMSPAADIHVRGRLLADGTQDEPIRLLPAVAQTRWGGICVENGSGGLRLSHVDIERASRGNDAAAFPAAVAGRDADGVLDHVRFTDVLGAVYWRGGMVNLSQCTFSDRNVGEQVVLKDCTADVVGCAFLGSPGGDAMDLEGVSEAVIADCIIYSSGADGIDIGDGCKGVVVADSRVLDCSDKGVSIGQRSDARIERSVIAGCATGVAVFDGSRGALDHVTLVGNGTGAAAYAATAGMGGGALEVKNSILAASAVRNVAIDAQSTSVFSYCLLDDEKIVGMGNITGQPRLLKTSERNFGLSADSPCINAADPRSDPDMDGSRADIGALPYRSGATVVINEINYNSPPFNDPGDWVELYNAGELSVAVSNWVLKDGSATNYYTLPVGQAISSGEYLLLCSDRDLFGRSFPDGPECMGDLGFGFSGSGEQVRLFDSGGAVIDSLTYNDKSPWPEAADGMGPTLSLIDPMLDNAVASNWMASVGRGTPGSRNRFSTTGVDGDNGYATRPFNLGLLFPNPFGAAVDIPIVVLEPCDVTVTIYSILGQRLQRLHSGQWNRGVHVVRFQGDGRGSGTYVCRVEGGGYAQSKVVVLVR